MKRHWSIWQGTVRAEVRGGEPERFLNACTEAGLVLRNIEYTAPQTLNISLPAEDRDRMERIIKRMAEAEGVDEKLKASDQLGWIGRMNGIRQRAEETVLAELVYG